MSNAMRFGKRSLAAVAAGALGAGLLIGLSASPASAVTATSATPKYPSMTLIVSGVNDTAINFPVAVTNTAGTSVTTDTLTDQRFQVSITAPATAADDTAVLVSFGSGTAGKTIETNDIANIVDVEIDAAGQFGNLIAAGNAGRYVITTRLFNTLSGAVISTNTVNVDIASETGAPAATIQYISGEALALGAVNPLNSLGASTGQTNAGTAAAEPDSFAVWVTNATGGPYVVPAAELTTSSGSINWTTATTSGWGGATTATDLRAYAVRGATAAWGSPGTAVISSRVTTVSSPAYVTGTGTLNVAVAGISANNAAPTVLLNTEPASYVGVVSGNQVYEVPVGTTAFSFTLLTTGNYTDDTTLQWNAWSNTNLGTVTASGGALPLRADTGSLSVNVSAAAAAVTKKVFVNFGSSASSANQTTVELRFSAPAPVISTSQGIATTGTAAVIPGTVETQFGAALPGTWAVSMLAPGVTACTATPIATATASATGAFTITAPASFAPAANGSVDYKLCANNGLLADPVTKTVTVYYTTTGGVSTLSLAASSPVPSGLSATSRPLVRTPANGTAAIVQTGAVWNGTSTLSQSTINTTATATLLLTATVNPQTTLTFTGTDGLLFSDRIAGSVFYQDAASTLVYPGDLLTAGGGAWTAEVSVLATKPGLHTVTVAAGTSTQTFTLYARVPSNAARTLAVEPTSVTLSPNSFRSFTATVKDIFGNAVPGYTGLGLALAGGGSIAGNITTAPATDAAGQTLFTYSAPAGTGDAQIALAGSTTGDNPWVTGAIAGAPDAVRTGLINIKVTAAGSKSIVIVGERGTVSGKPGIVVEGETKGFDVGTKMVPSIRFPGESGFTAGSARPTTSITGDFSWQRKTGKKTSVRFTNEAGDVRSNTIIIAAN